MISRGDFEMHSMQMYNLKQTMLSQETVFQKQVLELHRLYGIQKAMMQSFYDHGGDDLRKASDMPNLFPRTNPARDFFSLSRASTEQAINMRPSRQFDLRLSADQDLSCSDEQFNHCYEILEKKRQNECKMGILFAKNSCFLSEKNLINLGESIDEAAETSTPQDCTTLKNSTTKEESKSFDAGFLDLNEAYADDSSCNSNDPIVTQNHSPESSPDFSGVISANPTDILPLRSRSGHLEHCEDQTQEQGKETIVFSFGPESAVEDDEDGPAIMKNTPNLSSSACDQFSRPKTGSQVSKTSISAELEWISFPQIESKDKMIDKDEASAKADPLVQNAAILLINMSAENSARDPYYDQPQCSSDSFEMIALKLRENNADDYSVSSRLIETNNGDKRDYSFKLRRGRRLKDFQKEILPGLATLSRHEICEDINILEAVFRSKEYKKVKANTEDGSKWQPPPRSKRSSVRRRLLL